MTETEYAGLLLAVERCAEAIVRFGGGDTPEDAKAIDAAAAGVSAAFHAIQSACPPGGFLAYMNAKAGIDKAMRNE